MNGGTLFVGPTRRSRRSTGERVFRWRRPVRLLGNGFIGPWSEQGRDQIWARFGERDGRLGHDQLFKAALGELLEGVPAGGSRPPAKDLCGALGLTTRSMELTLTCKSIYIDR